MTDKEKIKKSLLKLAKLLNVATEKGTWLKGLAIKLGYNENRLYSWIHKGKIADAAILEIELKGYDPFVWLIEDWAEHALRKSLTHQEVAGVSRRVSELMQDLGYNRFQLYSKTNIDPKRANDFYVVGEVPRPRHIEIIAEKTGYNKDWLWYGKGARIEKKSASTGNVEILPSSQSSPIEFTHTDRFGKAVDGLKEIFDSLDSVLIPAIESNILAFQVSVRRDREIQAQRQMMEDLKRRVAALEEMLKFVTPQADPAESAA